MRNRLATAVLFFVPFSVFAQQTKSDADLKAEATQARTFYEASNFVAALPLYEDLYKQQPTSLVYEEALAMSLLGAATNMAPADAKAAHVRSKKLLLDARS